MPTKQEYRETINNTIPKNVQEAFMKYYKYDESLEYDPNENQRGKNAHATRLFRKAVKVAEEAGLGLDEIALMNLAR